VGDGWEVPIDRATARISLEDEATLSDPHCYSGEQGGTAENCQLLSATPLAYAVNNLAAGHGMTVTANLPSGYVTNYLQMQPDRLSFDEWAILGMLGAALLLGLWWMIRWLRARWRRRRQTVVAQYEPPAGLTPAEIGLLQDDTTATREVAATLIDLAVRGYLKIIQIKAKGRWRAARYRLELLKGYDDTTDYENELLQAIFGNRQIKKVNLDDVDTASVADAIKSMKKQLMKRLQQKGLYGRADDQHGLLDKVIDTKLITDEGAKRWAEVEGFKLYLSVVEKDRLNFTDAPAKTPERFNKLLPYAVALGVEKQWAKQFEGIDVTSQTGWYSGSGYPVWSASMIANDLSSSFSQSVGSNVVSTSSGSSGSGFGGGGGGSW
jgi:hypothetical protein